MKKPLAEEILDLLKERALAEHEYINPHFLQQIQVAIYDYYELEDDIVDDWVIGMFGA
jgi:hypothetical protein